MPEDTISAAARELLKGSFVLRTGSRYIVLALSAGADVSINLTDDQIEELNLTAARLTATTKGQPQ